jgi:hypothetical protein
MPARLIALALAGLLAACATTTASLQTAWSNDPAAVTPAAFGGWQDPEMRAIGLASWALAEPSRTHNNPVDAARAIAGVDLMAGRVASEPRWIGLSPLVVMQMSRARQEVRRTLGVAPDAPAAEVENRLLAFANETVAGNPAAALAALSAPVFTLGPRATYDRLVALPYLPEANVATMRLNASVSGSDGACPGCG